jgi:uncharacterized membrane protein YccC
MGGAVDGIATNEIMDFLRQLGERYRGAGTLFLLGGSALCMLGNPRRTLDIDYMTESPSDEAAELQAAIESLADELKLELEAVSFGEFIPLPRDADTRHRWIGQFGRLKVYVYDPYSIALSKVARGFEADLQDVLFLLRQDLITLEQLEAHVADALPHAAQFDMVPDELIQHLEEIRRLM